MVGGKMDNDQDIAWDIKGPIEMSATRDKSIAERDDTELRRLGKKQVFKVRMIR